MRKALEAEILRRGYTIIGKWEDSLKNGWRIEVRKWNKDCFRYSYLYADELFNEMLSEELRGE